MLNLNDVKRNKYLDGQFTVLFIVALRDEVLGREHINKARLRSYVYSLGNLVNKVQNIIVIFHSSSPKQDAKLFWRYFSKLHLGPVSVRSLCIKSEPGILSKGKGACELFVLRQIYTKIDANPDDLFIKLTARYRYINLKSLITRLISSKGMINFYRHPRTKQPDTSIFSIRYSEIPNFTQGLSTVNDLNGFYLEDYANEYLSKTSSNITRGWPIILIWPYQFRYGVRNFFTEMLYSVYEEILFAFSNRSI